MFQPAAASFPYLCTLLLGISLSAVATAAEETPLVIPEEASAIRQSLSNGWSAERAGQVKVGEALSNYRKAAIYGSSEGYYRAGKVLLSRNSKEGNGVCLLQVAAQLGHRKATELLSSMASRKGDAAVKCNDSNMRINQQA